MREPGVSRLKHFRAALSRQARGRGKDSIAITVLAAVAILLTLWIFTQQKAALPSWTPFVGEEFATLSADFKSAQAVTAGQGQQVVMAGVKIGKVSSVEVEDGHAVVGLDVDPKYLELIHPDATLLLRPKTNLNDMTVEVDPGTAPGHVEEGHHFPLSATEPNVQLEALLSTLDADTQQYLQLLVAGGAQGIGGRAGQVAGAFKRLEPFAHYLADLNRALAQRRRAIARSIHLFGELTGELARHDAQVERFVSAGRASLGNFANEQQAIQEALVEFPTTLATLQEALASSGRAARIARPAFLQLIPQAQALGPAFDATERLFEQTTAPIRDQIRPFTRQTLPVLRHTKQGSADFERAVRGFGNSLGAFNSFLNELAYKPKGRQGFLFYLPWLNHNLNATFNIVDGGGAVQRAVAMLTCNGAFLAYGLAGGANSPFVRTLLQSARLPQQSELPFIPADKDNVGIPGCGPK